ncbi:hypothetical protein HMF8227_01750 [Saliniradius amylolyticus]|uniref:Uncharacterized protein n=1 Tax=Saliniradius amylolyticus TaxID=2183582 RepID=A0A2S2E3K6_9ALTE|nr:hypothetical protein HMF8227_01750 [Saliniradius amylolyticus]
MSMDNDSAMKSGLLNSGLLILAAMLSGVSLSIVTFDTG